MGWSEPRVAISNDGSLQRCLTIRLLLTENQSAMGLVVYVTGVCEVVRCLGRQDNGVEETTPPTTILVSDDDVFFALSGYGVVILLVLWLLIFMSWCCCKKRILDVLIGQGNFEWA